MTNLTALTIWQKIQALHDRFYSGVSWKPKAGDLYTTARNDLELYEIITIQNGKVFTRYCDPARGDQVSEWDEAGFTTEGFGPKRVWVAPWVLKMHDPVEYEQKVPVIASYP